MSMADQHAPDQRTMIVLPSSGVEMARGRNREPMARAMLTTIADDARIAALTDLRLEAIQRLRGASPRPRRLLFLGTMPRA